MLLDIKRTVLKVQLRRMISLLMVCAIIIIIILTGNRNNELLGMNKYSWSLVVGLIYILVLTIEGMLEMNYIYFSDERENIIFRYFSMSIFNRKKNSIEIPKEAFAGYEILESLNGYKKKIILKQRLKTSVVKYPAVCLNSLTNEQRNALVMCLDKHVKK